MALFVFLAPRFFGWRFDPVLSGSMSPALRVGAVIVVQPVDPARVKVGDIITYHLSEEPGKRVTPRVVDVIYQNGSLTFRTKGDANEDPDPDIAPAARVLAKVSFNVPKLGNVLLHSERYTKGLVGFGLFIALPTVLLIGSAMRDMNFMLNPRKRRERQQKKRLERRRRLRYRR